MQAANSAAQLATSQAKLGNQNYEFVRQHKFQAWGSLSGFGIRFSATSDLSILKNSSFSMSWALFIHAFASSAPFTGVLSLVATSISQSSENSPMLGGTEETSSGVAILTVTI